MIFGAHVIVYSKDADADRAFIGELMGRNSADAGRGWMVYEMPPGEVACHPGEKNDVHELYFMCDDVQEEIKKLEARGVACSEVHDQPWGSLFHLTLPGGGKVGIYQPKHPMAIKR